MPQLPPPGSAPVSRFRSVEPVATGDDRQLLKVIDVLTGEPRALTVIIRESPLALDALEQRARLRHPALPRALEVGRTREAIGAAIAGSLFLLGEWIAGEAADRVAWPAAEREARWVALAADVLAALAALHAAGLVHGELSAGDVRIGDDGRAVLVGGPGAGEPRGDLVALGAMLRGLTAGAARPAIAAWIERLASGRLASARDALDALDALVPALARRPRPAAPLALPDGLDFEAVLDTDDVAAVIAVMLGHEPPRAWAHAVRVTSHGRPQVVIAMMRAIAGETSPWAIDWHARTAGGLAVWRAAQLAAAPTGARRVAVAIATWGGRVRIDRALAMLRADSKAAAGLLDVTELVRLGLAHRDGDDVMLDGDTRGAAEAMIGHDVIGKLAGATLDRLAIGLDLARDAAWIAPLFERAAIEPARAALACEVAERLLADGLPARALAVAHRAFAVEPARGGAIAARAAAAIGDARAAAAYARDAVAAGAPPVVITPVPAPEPVPELIDDDSETAAVSTEPDEVIELVHPIVPVDSEAIVASEPSEPAPAFASEPSEPAPAIASEPVPELASPPAPPAIDLAPLRELFARSVADWLRGGGFESAATAVLAAPSPPAASPPAPPVTHAPDDLRLKPAVAALERTYVDAAMARAGGNQTTAARLLGLSRFGLQKKLRRLDGEPAGSPEPADDE